MRSSSNLISNLARRRLARAAAALAALLALGCQTAPPRQAPANDGLSLADGYLALNEPLAARSAYEEVLRNDPGSAAARLGLANVAYRLEDYDQALAEIEALDRSPTLMPAERESANILRGRSYARMGKAPILVWATLYPVWREADVAVKSCLDPELKELARKVPPETEGREDVMGFVAPRRSTPREPPPPEILPPEPPPPAPGKILARSAWKPLAVHKGELTRMERPFRVTIHHSSHDDVVATKSLAASADLIRRIQKYHIEGNGWGDIGYHYIIDGQGQVWEGRSLAYQGAHAGGDNNRGNIGVVLIGDFERHRPEGIQVASLSWLLDFLCRKYQISRRQIYCHSQFRATDCPGRYLEGIVRALAARK